MNKSFFFKLLCGVTFCTALVVVSCSTSKEQGSTVSLMETDFGEEVAVWGNLSFTFDRNLMPDSMLGFWDTIPYIKFEPYIPGRFKWESSDKLVFSPFQSLPPATTFKASVTDHVLKYSKYELGEDMSVSFHTPDLKWKRVVIYWAFDDVTNKPYAKIDLEFNYQVNPATVMDKLTVEADGKTQSLMPIGSEPSHLVSFKLPDVKLKDETITSLVTLDGGIVPLGGNRSWDEGVEATVDIPSPYKVEILHVEAQHDGLIGKISVTTSQQIQIDKVESYLVFEPYVSVDVKSSDEGFIIESEDFDSDEKYDLTFQKGLPGAVGGTLKLDHTEQIFFGKLRPDIRFENSNGKYLSGAGLKNVGVHIVSIPEVKLKITKVYENNLLSASMYGVDGYYYDYYYYDDYYYDDYYYGSSSNTASEVVFGDVIYEETIETSKLPLVGGLRVLNLDFKDRLPEMKGQYYVEIGSTDDYWLREGRFISISDIGIISKVGQNTAQVWVNSIKSASPISGAEVQLWGANNQVVATGFTGGDGLVDLNLQNADLDGFKPAMVTVSTSNDFNYMVFSNTRVSSSQYDVGGYRENPSGLMAFLYPERDIYRPGETVNLAGIVRDMNWKSPGKLPVVIEVDLPNGKDYETIKKTLNAEGGFDISVPIASTGMTGSYSFRLYTSNMVLLGTKYISVEEFMPDRIKLTTSLDKEVIGIDEWYELSATAVNFFGPPAVDRNVEIDINYSRGYFYAKDHPGYDFYIDNGINYIDDEYEEGSTDENGNYTSSFFLDDYYSHIGMVQADIVTTVFDETGRSVSKRNSLKIHTQNVYYGLKYSGYYLTTDKTHVVPLIAVDWDGKALSGVDARVQVIKHEYKTVLAKSGSYFRYESQHEEVVMKDEIMMINGTSSQVSFVPKTSGKYEVRIMDPNSTRYVSKYYYAYGYGRTYSSSFEVSNEGSIEITLDKESYQVGEYAKVLLTAPFDGKMLVSMETNDVISSFFVETQSKSAEVTIPISKEYLPNVYVSATLIKEHKETEFPLTVAHGFEPLMVEDKSTELPVEITAVEKSRSRTKQTIEIQTMPNARVTIAAVDQGILQVTGFKTPDPHAYFYQKRALRVESFDVYPFLFPEISTNSSTVGGDGGMGDSKRLSPVNNNRVKLVSFWSGNLIADGAGKVRFDIDIPQFSGELRIMAAAYKGKAFGMAEDQMKVADPIVISSSLPRFMSPGDTVVIPVMLANTTDNKATGMAELSVDGPLKVVGDPKVNFNAGKQSETSVTFKAVAEEALGVGNFTIDVDCFGETFLEETEMPVRPASPLQQITGAGSINGGSSKSITIGLESFIPSSVDYQLVVARSPIIEFADDLEYLVRYPHGCTEQTISAAFPQLYFSDLVENMYEDTRAREDVQYNIEEALRQLKLRQLYNGALTMWPGYGTENWWVSCYALHFCIEAEKAGYDVDPEFVNPLMYYLKERLASKETIMYYYNYNQNKKIAPKSVPYSLFVLALANQPEISIMNYYKSNLNYLSLDGMYLLAAAFALAGDQASYSDILPGQFGGEESIRQSGGSFYSLARDEAIALYSLLEVDPDNPQVGEMTKHVSQRLKNGYLNTQERIFSLLALGKIAKEANKSTATASITSNGKTIGQYENGVLKLNTDDIGKDPDLKISTSGTGKLYYFWAAEGISADGSYNEEDSYLKIRKSFYDRNGRKLFGNTFEQNDLVVVKLSLENTWNNYVDNVVVSDILPAGFEIENPRIDEIQGTDWITNQSYPNYRDIRDDRINLYVSVGSTERHYYYVVRAVSLGDFQMGPVGAECMYDPEYHSYSGGGSIRVVPKSN